MCVDFHYEISCISRRQSKAEVAPQAAPRRPRPGGVCALPVRTPPMPLTNPPFPSARPPVFIRRHDARFWVCFRRFRNKCDDGERPQGQHLCLRPVFSPPAFVRPLRPLRCYAASLAPVGPYARWISLISSFAHQLFRSKSVMRSFASLMW